MSVKVSSWVWHGDETAEVSGNEMILLLALADVADDNGRCRYTDDEIGLTYDALASKARVDRRTIERLIPKLRERGLVVHSKGAKGRPNEFSIAVPWARSSADILSGNGQGDSADSPTAVQDSPTAATTFPDNDDIRTSIQRINVTTRSSSPVGAAMTKGTKFAEPLCNVLSAELLANGVKHTISKAWLADARLLVDRDERDPFEAKALIEWATHDAFWRSNILSMPTFRKQYDKLRLARERSTPKLATVDAGRAADAILRERAGQAKAIAS